MNQQWLNMTAEEPLMGSLGNPSFWFLKKLHESCTIWMKVSHTNPPRAVCTASSHHQLVHRCQLWTSSKAKSLCYHPNNLMTCLTTHAVNLVHLLTLILFFPMLSHDLSFKNKNMKLSSFCSLLHFYQLCLHLLTGSFLKSTSTWKRQFMRCSLMQVCVGFGLYCRSGVTFFSVQ